MHRQFWIVSDRHTSIHLDAGNRLHNPAGPARTWHDGWALWYWHGTPVPADLIEQGWDTRRILAEPNAEVRRCAIERIGWDEFVKISGMTPVAAAADPGNPPHQLELFDLPHTLRGMYGQPARILLCTNGTPERDGAIRRFGLPVPAHHSDPVAAAADLAGWPVNVYRKLQRRA